MTMVIYQVYRMCGAWICKFTKTVNMFLVRNYRLWHTRETGAATLPMMQTQLVSVTCPSYATRVHIQLLSSTLAYTIEGTQSLFEHAQAHAIATVGSEGCASQGWVAKSTKLN